MKNRLPHALLVALIPFLFAGCFKTRQEIAREREEQEVRANLQQNIVEYNEGLEKAQAEIGRLQGRIEELEHVRRKEMSGLQSGRESEQKTVDELKERLASLQESQTALFEEIKRLKEENLALSAERRASPAGAKKKVDKPRFQDAVAAYRSKDYEAAAQEFRAYIDANPKAKNTLDAHYYLGDILFLNKDFAAAVVEFGVVHERSPSTPLGRKSTLKIAQSFKAMGKDKDAKAFAQLLVQGSPSSPEANQARKLLK